MGTFHEINFLANVRFTLKKNPTYKFVKKKVFPFNFPFCPNIGLVKISNKT